MAAAEEETNKSVEAYPMKGRDGPNSYANNSTYQRGVVDAAKQLISRAIEENLDVEMFPSSNTFPIADLGCSIRPNTFIAVQNILEAVEFKYQGQGLNSQIPEVHVFFNDHTSNDFNVLFQSLPPSRQYYAAGVPGSFYVRVFPNASIPFFHSSYALHWLSRVPKEVADRNSGAWNKGRIVYSNSTDEVVRAYEAQHAEDKECFLRPRAQEIVNGGLMVLIIAGRPNGTPHSLSSVNQAHQLLGSCLMDLAGKGVVREEKVDSFNLPVYYMSPQELEAAVEKNGCFSTERIENLPRVSALDDVTKRSQVLASHVRVATEGLVKKQFGDNIVDELFDVYRKRLGEQLSIFEFGKVSPHGVSMERQPGTKMLFHPGLFHLLKNWTWLLQQVLLTPNLDRSCLHLISIGHVSKF